MATSTADDSPTQTLAAWISSLNIADVPEEQITRSKYLVLDGLAAAITCAHLPHSETAARALFLMEPGDHGSCSVIGYPGRKLTPVNAALLNSTFVQGFELDDWHTEAPVHSNSIVLPSLMAAVEQKASATNPSKKTSGKDFLLATIVGYETGPRVGNALWGRHVLTEGWHSGAVFGPSQAAAAVAKLYGLSAETLEDAFGIACTQACGLMSAQFESEAKRMQHGFAARNGLFAVLLAQEGYVGIKKVFEREYGGFLQQFSKGNGKTPAYRTDELTKNLGSEWKLDKICVKPYSSMAGTHGTVDAVIALQEEYPELLKRENLGNVKHIDLQLDDVMFHHGGFEVQQPLTATGAQMSAIYVCATQMVDRIVLAKQFGPKSLEKDEIWSLVNKTSCKQGENFQQGQTQLKITFENGQEISKNLLTQRGVKPALTNDEIVDKWRTLANQVMDEDRINKIENLVLGMENLEDVQELIDVLSGSTKNPLA